MSPWLAILRALRLPKDEPRVKIVWQWYHHKYSDRVTEEYRRRGGSSPADSMRARNAIAQEQYNALSFQEKQELQEEVQAIYQEEMEKWERMDGAPDIGEVTAETQEM